MLLRIKPESVAEGVVVVVVVIVVVVSLLAIDRLLVTEKQSSL